MKDNQVWSTSVGRWHGIPVRIHLFLILFIALMYSADWRTATATAIVLALSVIVHELAHVFAVTSIGGRVDEVVLMPWGGNSEFTLPDRGYIGTLAYLAGPFASGMLFLLGLTLIIQTEASTIFQLVNPFKPHAFALTSWNVSIIEIMTWVNFQLMLVNLIPCFPFDGAQIIRSLIRGSKKIDSPQDRVETAIKVLGNAVAIGLIIMAFLFCGTEFGAIRPAWLVLLLSGISMLFAANYSMHVETSSRENEWREFDELDYGTSLVESSLYLDSVDDIDNIAYSQWLSEKQEARREQELRVEREEDQMADVILEKLHASGGDLKCLTPDERLILDRFSERIRKRRQQSV